MNFKESLQQIYEGDKMSKKESYLLTKEYSYQSKHSFSCKSSRSDKWAINKNEGTVKCDLYPSVVMMKRDLKGFS